MGQSLHSSSELLNLGWSPSSIRTAIRAGTLARVRRGAYVFTNSDEAQLPASALIEAAEPFIGDGVVLSHLSAAALWGMPLWRLAHDRRVWLTRSGPTRGNIRGPVHMLNCPWSRGEVAERDGVPITTMARTAVDLGRTFGADAGIVAADWVLRQGVSPDELREVLENHRRRPGVRAARLAVTMASPLAESAAESVSRLRMWQVGLPRPVEQREFFDGTGRLVARGDFTWEDERLVGECDGRMKYDKPWSGRPSDAVAQQRYREDWLREHGWAIVRWMAEDLDRPRVFHRRIAHALAERGRQVAA